MADTPDPVDQLTTDSGLMHDIVHSQADTVETDSGPIKTVYKLLTDIQAQADALLPSVAPLATTAAQTYVNGLSGAASGLAPLDTNQKIPATYLPAYVDEVQEFANVAAFPASGAAGIIYIAIDTRAQYRWSGTTYTELVSSPGTTDAVVEGATNLYFTNGRAIGAVLTGYAVALANSVVAATDSISQAVGKLQKQISDLALANTGDETIATIKTKLNITVLSGNNTGDQTLVGLGGIASALIGAANGVAPLDGTSKIPAAFLPSYVSDIAEYANLAAFPSTGTVNIIYIAQDTNAQYRWTGTVYVELVSSPGTTDAVVEGTTNKYFSNARAIAAVLTGYAIATVNASVAAGDSILIAFGKVEKQIADLATANTGTNTGDETKAGILGKLGALVLTGTNTGDQTLAGLGGVATALIGAASGIAPLDSTSKIPAAYLPSYVSDVAEYANLAGFPASGTLNIIYIALDTNKTYRWSGSVYIEISPSPGSTDAVVEGATNLYFTVGRVLATAITGYASGANTALAATDTLLAALGKIQGQLTAHVASIAAAITTSNAYTDSSVAALANKGSVRTIATTNIVLSGTQTVNGVALVAGDVCLVAGQAAGAANGPYVVAAGAWTRATNFNTSALAAAGASFYIREGTLYVGTIWVLSTINAVLGTTALVFKLPALTGGSYDPAGGVVAKPGGSAVVMRHQVVRSFNLPAAFAGSLAVANTAATASTVFAVWNNHAGTNTQIGTITWGVAGTAGTFAAATATSLVAGDILTVVAPATADATLADIAFTFLGTLS